MLHAPVQPSNCTLPEQRQLIHHHHHPPGGGGLGAVQADDAEHTESSHPMADTYDDLSDDDGEKGGRNKSRRELPPGAVATLKAWLLSPEHFSHPYPTPQDQAMLMQKTGIDKKQLKNWFTNARRRIWKPMLKKQIESGQITASGTVAGVVPGLMLTPLSAPSLPPATTMENPHSVQAMRVHYQQVVGQTTNLTEPTGQSQQQPHQQQQQPHPQHPSLSMDSYTGANTMYAPPPPLSDPLSLSGQFFKQQDSMPQLPSATSLGTLPPLSAQQQHQQQLSKTDSHAVLMELFARDQDLVRQATESARLKAEAKQQQQQQQQQQSAAAPATQGSDQHPMKVASPQGNIGSSNTGNTISGVPTLNSWPHFSSITSLNNLGTIPGVKSINSLSGVDLSSKGSFSKIGSLAQIKSMESMGKNDSYAFLEVFFGDRIDSSTVNLSSFGGSTGAFKSVKQSGDEDNEIGLSLEDESPSQATKKEFPSSVSSASQGTSRKNVSQDSSGSTMESGTLKRAYDDALAARGLMSVSRSSEKLTDLVLPEKIQRTLSQEFIAKEDLPQGIYSLPGNTSATNTTNNNVAGSNTSTTPWNQSSQYPGQQPGEPSSKGYGQSASNNSESGSQSQGTTNVYSSMAHTSTDSLTMPPHGWSFSSLMSLPSANSENKGV